MLLFFLTITILLSLPIVQTKIASYLTNEINTKYKTNISIEEVAITFLGNVKLKNVLILDHHKDTLIYSKRIKTSILDFKKLLNDKFNFGDIRMDDLILNIKNYKNEKETNLDLFVETFDDGKPSSGRFLLTSKNIYLSNSRFVMIDENRVSPKDVDFSNINGVIQDFKIKGPNLYATIKILSFKDFRGVYVTDLHSDFIYTKKNIILNKLQIKTNESFLKGRLAFFYNKDNHDFSDFNNRVKFDFKIDSSSLSSNEIRCYYIEIGKKQRFFLKSKLKGTLNNFYASKLEINDLKSSIIKGDVNFKNLFPRSPGEFYMKGDFSKISSNYQELTKLLPNILGKKLPSILQKFGQFNYTGRAEVTQKYINTNFIMNTSLGIIESDLKMSSIDDIDKAKYQGNVKLDNFNLGYLISNNSLERVSFDLDIDGIGFKEKYLNTNVKGNVFAIKYNGYNYSKIVVDGAFKDHIFNGNFNVNDPNLFMDFNGMVDLSKKENKYDFHSKIDYANLYKLNFIEDTTSIFKGETRIKANGNTIDDLRGDLILSNASYQNSKNTYFVDSLTVHSEFDPKGERSIKINSIDVIEGSIVGKYKFNQLQKIVENALGSLYTNYHPNKVLPNQYLKFNLLLNGNIVELINPNISMSKNTTLTGNLSSETKYFKLNFNSPEMKVYNNTLNNFLIKVDNTNPLYSSYIQSDSIKTKLYTIRDFSLINNFSKDTLNFRSEFKGGKDGKDFYNLNFYHTMNKENRNVIGFKKSEFKFKDYLWFINEQKKEDENKIVFDKKLQNFSFEKVMFSHENQSIEFDGSISNKLNKDLQLTFSNVNLNKITPEVEKFKFEGNLNGKVNLKQSNAIYQPTSDLQIDNLNLNGIDLGVMNLTIKGNESLEKFHINSNITKNNIDNFTSEGDIIVDNNDTKLDLDLNFDQFNLGVLGKVGGDVIKNIRGLASGTAHINGNINELDYNGRIFVSKSGLSIPYLGTDYSFEDNSVVDITENKFILREVNINDTQYNSKGVLSGFIQHKKFGDWSLDLTINSNRLLALNTKDSEDAAYYGTAFMNGTASIKGPTENLYIKVNAESAKGTDIKIPINDNSAVDEKGFITFLSQIEKNRRKKQNVNNIKNYNGLELEFNFDINDNANIEVILNRESGHGMKGKGFGTLLFRINTLGKFEMFGDFLALEGSYNFKYGGLIDKKFDVKKGGSIIWSGDPMSATLNLEAVYKTSANPAVLIDNPSFNKKVDVEVVIGVKGNLSNPDPDFNINFPTVGSTLKSELQYKLDDKDKRQTQALYLLSTGSFLSQEGVAQNQFSNNLYERASSLFNDIFKGDSEKIKLGIDYVNGDKRTPGYQTDGRFGVSVSSKINEKITVNGKVGVPIGGITETAIVGDVEVQYSVNTDGTLNLRIFNKENNINYIGQGIGYTQGVGMTYEVDFDTFSELVNKIFKNTKIEKANPIPQKSQSDDLLPDNYHFKNNKEEEKNKNNSKKETPNKEAIPTEE